ncbi:hypothetical protein [Lactobacillus sp. PSON]|uniref:hypothetical protein n=1 Tax=Lactobacillus sp. PSON TaxID=3455454 RepID=UPI004043763F
MTDFKSVFKQIFNQKKKYIYLVLLVQLFAVVFMTVSTLIQVHGHLVTDNWVVSFWGPSSTLWTIPSTWGFITTGVADLTLVGLLAFDSQKINMSQTWHLMPSSNVKLYLSNLFTNLLSCLYLFVIQIVVLSILALCIGISVHEDFAYDIKAISSNLATNPDIQGFLDFGCLILLIAILAYTTFTFIDLINLASYGIINNLPVKSTKYVRWLVIAILVIFATYIYILCDGQIRNVLSFNSVSEPLWITDLEVFVCGLICMIFNIILINKYVEPKIVNR